MCSLGPPGWLALDRVLGTWSLVMKRLSPPRRSDNDRSTVESSLTFSILIMLILAVLAFALVQFAAPHLWLLFQ